MESRCNFLGRSTKMIVSIQDVSLVLPASPRLPRPHRSFPS